MDTIHSSTNGNGTQPGGKADPDLAYDVEAMFNEGAEAREVVDRLAPVLGSSRLNELEDVLDPEDRKHLYRWRQENAERAAKAGGTEIVRLSDVEPETVRWLWPGRIPLGKLTILDGDPGLGKSTLTLDLAARISRGEPMPDGEDPSPDGPRGTVLLTAEDGLADTIRPRLDAAGADPEHVAALRTVAPAEEDGQARLPTVNDTEDIRAAVRTVDAALVVVDPLVAYLGGDVNSHRDQDVRKALAGLTELAEEEEVAVLAIRHLNKSGGSNPLYRGGGSIGLVAAARVGLLVAADPEDPEEERRVLAPTKANLSEEPPALAFHLETVDSAVRIVWDGETGQTARDLLDRPSDEQRTKAEEAQRWLRGELADGPRPVKDLKREVGSLGFSWRTVESAKNRLDVKASREGGVGSEGRWVWKLTKTANGGLRTKGASDLADLGNGPSAPGESSDGNPYVRKTQNLADLGDSSGGECRECGASIGPAATICGPCRRAAS